METIQDVIANWYKALITPYVSPNEKRMDLLCEHTTPQLILDAGNMLVEEVRKLRKIINERINGE